MLRTLNMFAQIEKVYNDFKSTQPWQRSEQPINS